MSITQNDGVYTKGPKPTNLKGYAGSGSLLEFATKEDIPTAYRFEGMVVQEELAGVYKTWRLEGGIADGNYEEVVSDSTGLEILTEGGQTGWRLIDREAAFYGNIGDDATDLSTSTGPSSTYGATGQYAFATGLSVIASGIASFATGELTTASGDYAVAEGKSTIASGDNAHAEGILSQATGNYSHAEGNTSIASGVGAHAEGSGEASGQYSHAEGTNSEASGNNSHAEGSDTIASGVGSHASGIYCTAVGDGSYAGGIGDSALSNPTTYGRSGFTHQEVTAALGNYGAAGANSVVLGGKNNRATGARTIVLGGTNVLGATDDMVYVPALKPFSYTTVEIAAFTTGELGAILYDVTQNKLVQCTDNTPSALVFTPLAFAGAGTVTSVAISGTDGIQIDSGSPITTSGTIQLGIDKTTLLAHINVEDGADVTDAANVAAAGAVMNTGNETVAGIKTFSSFPVTPSSAPSNPYDVANMQFVEDTVASLGGYRTTQVFDNVAVGNLGSAQTLIAAPGIGYYWSVDKISVKITVTTLLEVGAQNLIFTYGGSPLIGNALGSLDNAQVETATTKRFHIFIQSSSNQLELAENQALTMILDSATNPVSGDVSMSVTVHYTKETY